MSDPKLDEMTLRDLLALFAVAGLAGTYSHTERVAELAYRIADDALVVREQTKK